MPGLRDDPRGTPRLSRRWKANVGDHVIALGWTPAGHRLAAASVAGPVTLFDADGGIVHTLAGHGFGTTSLSWRGDGSLLATAGQDGKVRLWDAATGAERAALPAGAAWAEHVRWHPAGDRLASAAGKKVRLWSADGAHLRDYADHRATIADLAWRPGTGELTTATYGGAYVWPAEGDEPTHRLEWPGSVLKLAWSPDGSRLAHGNQDATVHFWLIATGQDLQMSGYPLKVRELSWDATGRYLATGGGDRVTVWDCAPPGPEGGEPLSFKGHLAPLAAVAFQAKGPLLASGGLDGKVLLFQPGKFKKAVAQADAGAAVAQLCWAANDRLLAVGTETGEVVVYSCL